MELCYHVFSAEQAKTYSVLIFSMAIAISLVILILSVIAHEVAHGYAANWQGDPTARLAGRLTLNPLPHIDPLGSVIIPALLVISGSPIMFGWAKPVPYNPYNLRNQRWGEVLVALAGVLTNLFLAIVFGLVVRFGTSLGLPQTALSIAATVSFVNLFLAAFNLIPFPPLDGFTALRAALPWRFSSVIRTFEANMRGMGAFTLIFFLLVFSYVLAGPFFNFIVRLFELIAGGGTL